MTYYQRFTMALATAVIVAAYCIGYARTEAPKLTCVHIGSTTICTVN